MRRCTPESFGSLEYVLVGGEMVPHLRIVEKLHELAGATGQRFAVTAVPGGKKGERIMVIHTLSGDKLAPVLDAFAQCDLPAALKQIRFQ